ncbi:GNAT family N-acetyltransferase [Marinilabilia salmonicolor]|uniref:GNAT family N-acetyltransferase n=1 Tax=Marinilabilia salmonicolor TaxID=989 RepID=UPI00029B3297|nr:GNAT family N-acetyltransferase [Marinilabilia salmonicolor]
MKYTNALTSLGAVWMNNTLYFHPPQTRHGLYPYPDDMRHGLYSVTKSLAGALALLYFEEQYEDDVFSALITDYVQTLANHAGWQEVTFSHTLNMVTGTIGCEDDEHLFSTLILAETAKDAINNIARLGDAPPWGKLNDKALYIHSLVVSEKYTGRGIGKKILQPIEADARQTGYKYLRLDSDSKNPKLCYYYEKQGFEKVGIKSLPLSTYNLYQKKL